MATCRLSHEVYLFIFNCHLDSYILIKTYFIYRNDRQVTKIEILQLDKNYVLLPGHMLDT